MPTNDKPSPRGGIDRRLVLLFAVACGVAVANLYYAQPVLQTVAKAFGSDAGTAGLIVTFSQIGYALGLALLVPLGDLLPRRRLVPAVLAFTTIALLVSAVAPAISVLVLVALVIGAGSVVAQMLVPMAASMADDENRGQVVGSVMSGLLMGILLARTVSGFIAYESNWRVVYIAAAVLTAVTAIVLARVLPREVERPQIRYRALLRSTVKLFVGEPVLRRRALYGALSFATFSVFWTTIAFLLSGAPYHYDDLTIGLFGLGGAAGALCARFAGRWVDRGLHYHTTALFSVLIGVSFLLLWYGRSHLVALLLGVLVLDFGVQGLQVTNQSLIYALAPNARSRITSAYMVCYFLGGAAGSAAGSYAYARDHWAGACLLGGIIGVVAALVAIAEALRNWRRQRASTTGGPDLLGDRVDAQVRS
jgi:predicted MFS family arabinose efflux permease